MQISLVRRNWSATGGAENYLNRLAQTISARGHEVELLCEEWNEAPKDIFKRVIPLKVTGSAPCRPLAFARKVNDFLDREPRPCVLSLERGIHAHLYRAGDGVHRAWMRQRRKFHPVLGRLRNKLNLKNYIFYELEKQTFQDTPCIIANSEMVKRDILRYFTDAEDRITVIPNGVDADYFSNGNRAEGRRAFGLKDDEFAVLLVGAGKERKGISYAKETARQAGVRLIIVDRPPPCPLASAYAAADAFLLPSLYDPFANVTLEAMSAGLPVITTRDNGACEAIQPGQNGFLVDSAKQTAEMAAMLITLKSEPALRERIGLAAQQTAHEYSFQKNVDATIALCEQGLCH